jgi:hypothetical protein
MHFMGLILLCLFRGKYENHSVLEAGELWEDNETIAAVKHDAPKVAICSAPDNDAGHVVVFRVAAFLKEHGAEPIWGLPLA